MVLDLNSSGHSVVTQVSACRDAGHASRHVHGDWRIRGLPVAEAAATDLLGAQGRSQSPPRSASHRQEYLPRRRVRRQFDIRTVAPAPVTPATCAGTSGPGSAACTYLSAARTVYCNVHQIRDLA